MVSKNIIKIYVAIERELENEALKYLAWYHKSVKPIDGFDYLDTVESIDEYDIFFSGVKRGCFGDNDNYDFYLETKILYDAKYRKSLKNQTKEGE